MKLTKTITFTSGKGGVGKTTLLSNVAVCLAQMQKRVLILDGDCSMANVDIMMRVRAEKTIYNALFGTSQIKDVIIKVSENVYLIPGCGGAKELSQLTHFDRKKILDEIEALPIHFDYLLVDTSPGLHEDVLYLNSAANEINIVVTRDPSSLMDSYALIKVLNRQYKETHFSITCNMVKDKIEGMDLFSRLSDVVNKFICVSLDYKGCVPTDEMLRRTTRTQQLITQRYPKSPSAVAIQQLAATLGDLKNAENIKGSLQFFWKQVLQTK